MLRGESKVRTENDFEEEQFYGEHYSRRGGAEACMQEPIWFEPYDGEEENRMLGG